MDLENDENAREEYEKIKSLKMTQRINKSW